MSIRRTASAALAGTAVFAVLFGASPAGERLVGSCWDHLHQQQDQVVDSVDSVDEPLADHFAVC